MKPKNEKELIEWIYGVHLQNLNGREEFYEAFKKGIEATVEEMKDLKRFDFINSCPQCGCNRITMQGNHNHKCLNSSCEHVWKIKTELK